MWAFHEVFYQIYPIGFCGAPRVNDGITVHRIKRVEEFIPHLKKLGTGAVLFNPVFESDSHGYNTRDLQKIDVRLGTNDDFRLIVQRLHENGIRVLLDGVFNHVGRGFFAFRDVCRNHQDSRYCGWFYLDFNGDSCFHDGFYYEGWEGCYDLVKLNLSNPEVRAYLFDSVRLWIRDFDIDGLRLDVAYLLDRGFLYDLAGMARSLKEEFFFVGEALFGDYNPLIAEGMLDSVTNYECYKGIYSSLNSRNFFEISYSYNRQFGKDPWCLYRGRHLFSFLDNHDVGRIASVLNDERDLRPAYGLLFSMPGIPCVYYGSEWGLRGRKEDGDDALRPETKKPEWNELTEYISRLSDIRKAENALSDGGYRNLQVTNRQLSFARETGREAIYAFFNIDDQPFEFSGDYLQGTFQELIENKNLILSGKVKAEEHSVMMLKRIYE